MPRKLGTDTNMSKAVSGFELWQERRARARSGADTQEFRYTALSTLPFKRRDLYCEYLSGLSELWEQRAAKKNVENGVIPHYFLYKSGIFAWRAIRQSHALLEWKKMTPAAQKRWYENQMRPLQNARTARILPMILVAFRSMGLGTGVMALIAKHCGVWERSLTSSD